MTVHNLGDQNSILNQFISEIRDSRVQKDSMRFRRNIERIGEVLGYEFSKELAYVSKNIETPLGNKSMYLMQDQVVICSILRAGLPLHQGLLNYFDTAENGFISAFRKHEDNEDNFEVVVDYFAAPSLDGKILVLADPMLATGKTLENVLKGLKDHGTPEQIHIVSVIGAKAGIDYIKDTFPKNTHLWIAAIDPDLNARGYIIPGIGDAGDLAFGEKL
ncbi:uracil phosphoribosyltransferase [Maribacter hydrothermalis]|uniref:Uracil phosphoribosyltransferase n=1 Tax=Maribacter hydrothermalis TaxID=1836467 RepID=A0A1B7YYX5_9FLAO|nr:uracil phosphoribosyltransferase [Maribacter hydrothermalis]APQ16141.1 uracil phosphoribosyltransferase [Maribacter hydrothermalis]OBR35682.1 uracil phosphoribosyltransferase [Maribacter hydrothermalis]